MTSYALFMFFAGAAAMRDASGNVTDLVSGNLTSCTSDLSCNYGLFNSYQVGVFIMIERSFSYISLSINHITQYPQLISIYRGVGVKNPDISF